MKFVPPLLIMLFATTICGVWMLDMKRRHMLFFGLSFATFTCGLLVQILQVFPRLEVAALVATAFYLAACLMFCEAVMLRLGKQFSPFAGSFICAITLISIGYMTHAGMPYGDMATAANFGLGSLLTILCFKSREWRKGDWVERIFHDALIVFAAHFFLRSVFTIGMLNDVLSPEQLVESRYWGIATIGLSFAGVLLGLLILVVATSDVINELQHERDADPMTGILNRRGLERYANKWLATEDYQNHAIIMADIDHFKAINDDFGHAAGDQLLIEFSNLLRSIADGSSIVARIGGEEFLLLVKGTPEQCEMFGNRLCNKIARYPFSVLPPGRRATSSFGIAMLRQRETLWAAAERADIALMRVKKRGRNRVGVEGHEFPSAVHADYLLTA
ncbi:GGDEF domain-containing protein [Brucella sp. TWI432]